LQNLATLELTNAVGGVFRIDFVSRAAAALPLVSWQRDAQLRAVPFIYGAGVCACLQAGVVDAKTEQVFCKPGSHLK